MAFAQTSRVQAAIWSQIRFWIDSNIVTFFVEIDPFFCSVFWSKNLWFWRLRMTHFWPFFGPKIAKATCMMENSRFFEVIFREKKKWQKTIIYQCYKLFFSEKKAQKLQFLPKKDPKKGPFFHVRHKRIWKRRFSIFRPQRQLKRRKTGFFDVFCYFSCFFIEKMKKNEKK